MCSTAASPKFAVGDKIRVKPGVRSADYPDICMEGWTGTVEESREGCYLIHWSRETYESIPKDERISEEMRWNGTLWPALLCEDELLHETGQPCSPLPFTPPALTEPTKPGSKPLSWNNQEDRIRAALGLSGDDPLPKVGAETLRRYKDYLRSTVSFDLSFEANYPNEGNVWVGEISDDDEIDEFYGVACNVCGSFCDWVPLSKLEVPKDNPNYQLIADYVHWLKNWR